MSATAVLALATAACTRHTDGCPVCQDPPDITRGPDPACHTGRHLHLRHARAWRGAVIALSTRGRP
jgi:hypothetical protein